ncbi:MAG: hypothetical protein IJM34_12075 [Lachnospiraceae bacterium]|nr:hypothetical protein [Lachnospiraceae bacterium]
MKIIKDITEHNRKEYTNRSTDKWKRYILFDDMKCEELPLFIRDLAMEFDVVPYCFHVNRLLSKREIDVERYKCNNVRYESIGWILSNYDRNDPPVIESVDMNDTSYTGFVKGLTPQRFEMLKDVSFDCWGNRWVLDVTIDLEHRYAEITKRMDLEKDREYYQDDNNGTILRCIGARLERWDSVGKKWNEVYGDSSYAREIWMGQGNNCLSDISEEMAAPGGEGVEEFYHFENIVLKELIERGEGIPGVHRMQW